MPQAKAKKPATPGKKEEKGEAKKPLQEKKADNAPAKAKKEGAAKPAAPKKSAKPAGDGKGKDQGKKRKLNETGQGKPKQGADSKKKKVEKKVQGKSGAKKTGVGKKPVKKQFSAKIKALKRDPRRRRLARRGRSEIVVYEGRRYFLLPSGHLKAVLDFKLEDNDKVAKIDGVYIRKSDVKTFEDYKESVKSSPPNVLKRKLKLKLQILKRALMKELLKEAKTTNKQALATAKDAGKEVQLMTLYKNTWVRKKAVPRLLSYARNKLIKIKAARKEKGGKELTEAEQKILQRYVRRILQDENRKLRQALLSKRPSVAGKQKSGGKGKKKGAKPAKKPAAAKGKEAAPKGDQSKKQKRPAKKAAN